MNFSAAGRDEYSQYCLRPDAKDLLSDTIPRALSYEIKAMIVGAFSTPNAASAGIIHETLRLTVFE